jgi:hypothetical protein
MKKLLLSVTLMTCFSNQNIVAEMRYNPLNNLIYSYPETPNINQDEYRMLILGCVEIISRISVVHGGKKLSKKEILDQYEFYLKAVGTSTALRLLADLRNDVINYANGSFMKKIFHS